MTTPQIITRRRLKWSLSMATLVIASTYAFSLMHGWKYERDAGRNWRFWTWVMRGRLEMAVQHNPHHPEDKPFRFSLDPLPVDFANGFHWNERAIPIGRNRYLLSAQYPWFATRPNPRFDLQRSDEPLFGKGSGWVYVAVPLWFPLLLFAAPTVYLWRTERQAKFWQCPNCRYDLRGIESRVCPECGEPTEDSTVAQVNRPDASPPGD